MHQCLVCWNKWPSGHQTLRRSPACHGSTISRPKELQQETRHTRVFFLKRHWLKPRKRYVNTLKGTNLVQEQRTNVRYHSRPYDMVWSSKEKENPFPLTGNLVTGAQDKLSWIRVYRYWNERLKTVNIRFPKKKPLTMSHLWQNCKAVVWRKNKTNPEWCQRLDQPATWMHKERVPRLAELAH